MPSTDSTYSSSTEESEKMVHSRSHDPSQAIPQIPPPSSSDSESDDDSDAVTPPSKTHQQQEQKKEQQTQKQKKDQLPPTSPSPSALLSNKTAPTKILAKRPSVQSSPAPSQARPIPPPSSSDASSDDDSESLTPLPKTHQQQEQKKNQQPQKQKKEQPLPTSPSQSPSPSSSALHSNKTTSTKTSAKRSREEESNGIPEPLSIKKKIKGQTVQHSDEVPAKEKKKAHKQNVAEAVRTPSSPQKSAKKAVQVWNSKDELAFLNGLLSFTKEGKEFPKNMSPVYDYVRNTMDIHYSNKQLGDKLRRLKAKFWSLVENRRVNNYNFKSTEEAATYKICEQLWGVQDEGDGDDEHYHIAGTEGNASMNGKEKKKKKKPPVEAEEEDGEDQGQAEEEHGEDQGQAEEEDEKKIKDGEDQGDEEEEGQDEPTRNKTMVNDLVKCNEGHLERISRELYSKLSKDRDGMLNEMKHTMVKILEESQAKTMAMVQDFFLKESQTKTRAMVQDHLLNARAGHVQLPFSDTMTGILSGRWAPVPNREALEEKWRTQQIVEMEAFSGRLDLMREECKMCLEELRESASNGRS